MLPTGPRKSRAQSCSGSGWVHPAPWTSPYPNPTFRVREQGTSAGGYGPAATLGRSRAPTSSLPRTQRASGTAAKTVPGKPRELLGLHTARPRTEGSHLPAQPTPAAPHTRCNPALDQTFWHLEPTQGWKRWENLLNCQVRWAQTDPGARSFPRS